jgi:putative copper export protein
MDVLLLLHLVAAATWLGGLLMLGVGVLVVFRTLPREQARPLVARLGRAFAVVAAVAWVIVGASGLALAASRGWSQLLVGKTVLAVLIVLASAAHVVTGRRTDSRPLIVTSRALAAFILAGTVAVFYLGIKVAG